MIQGINHINISVSDIERSFHFYHEIIGLKPLCKWPQGAYLLAGEDWFCLNVTENRSVNIVHDYTHYAFSVNACDFAILVDRLIQNGNKPFKENRSEGESFYFLDPDGHQLELHVGDWKTRLRSKKLNPWPNTQFFI